MKKTLREKYGDLQLDVFDANDLNLESFVSDYLLKNRPVLIKVTD